MGAGPGHRRPDPGDHGHPHDPTAAEPGPGDTAGAGGVAGVVGVVGGRPVPAARVLDRLAALRAAPAGVALPAPGTQPARQLRRWVAQVVFDEELLDQQAEQLGVGPAEVAAAPSAGELDLDPGGSGWLATGSIAAAVLTGSATARAVFVAVTRDVTVGEPAVRERYDRTVANRPTAELRTLRHVLVGSLATARDVAARLAGGADFATVAAEHSTDAGTATRGGLLGPIRRGDLAGPVEDAAFAAAVGAVVGPVHSPFGWHLLRVDAVVPARVRGYAEERPRLLAELLLAARRQRFVEWLDRRRAELVRPAPGFEHPGDPRQPDYLHQH